MKLNKKQKLLELGANLAGGSLGAGASVAVGFVLGSKSATIAALVNGVATPLITEFSKRLLTSQQKARVGAVYLLAKKRFDENIQAGKQLNEGFFRNSDLNNRSDAEEIWEGVLQAAENENQEKKLPFLANLMANIAFENDIDRAQANYLVKLATSLSYQKFCLLSIFADSSISLKLRPTDYRGNSTGLPDGLVAIIHEIMEMGSIGLVGRSDGVAMISPTDIIPNLMTLYGSSTKIGRLMQLDEIPDEDLQKVAQYLV